MLLSRVGFHVHQLKINGNHSLSSQFSWKHKTEKKLHMGLGDFCRHIYASHYEVQLIVTISVLHSNSTHCLSPASWLRPSPPTSCSYSWFPPWIGRLCQDLRSSLTGTSWHHQVSCCSLRWFFVFFCVSRQTRKWHQLMQDDSFSRQFSKLPMLARYQTLTNAV